MALLLTGEVRKVTNGGQASTNKETGEQRISDPFAFIISETSNDSEAGITVEKLKLKDNLQAEAFRRLVGREISVPVRIYAFDGTPGLYLEKGVLPTPTSSAPLPSDKK